MDANSAVAALATLAGILRVNDRLPRRVVLLPDGSLGDKAAWPHLPEVEVLSRVTEVIRAALKQPCHSRHAARLLEDALKSNEPGAWEAVRDDLMTGDMDTAAAVAIVQQGQSCSALVSCLVGARDDRHLADVLVALAAVLPGLSEEARAELGRCAAYHLPAIADAFTRHSAFLTTDVRDAMLSGFGKVLAGAAVDESRLADVVCTVLASRREDLLRMFLHVPATFVRHRPEIVAHLVERAKAVPPCNRYPVLAMLAKLLHDGVPGVAPPRLEDVNELVRATLLDTADCVDTRTCLAAAAIVTACPDNSSGGHGPLCTALAKALAACSAALVTHASGCNN